MTLAKLAAELQVVVVVNTKTRLVAAELKTVVHMSKLAAAAAVVVHIG